MPNDSSLEVSNKSIFRSSGCFALEDEQHITYYDKDGTKAVLTVTEIGEKFMFEYSQRLVFLHEKDLRNCLFQCIDRNDQCAEWLSAMRQALLHNAVNDSISIRYIGEVKGVDVGHGVFAEVSITQGTYIGEYVGLVSTVSETITRDNHYNFQYPSCEGDLEINGREFGNLTRFINHSLNPNAEFIAISMDDIMHVICVRNNVLSAQPLRLVLTFLFISLQVTSKDLQDNEELTVDYGAAFWMRQKLDPR